MPLNNPPAPAAGGSALDANNNQIFPAALGVSTVAAGSVSERVLTRAGNSQFAFANADIPDILAMPSLENVSVFKLESNGNAGAVTTNCTAAVAGAVSNVPPTFATYTTSKALTSYASTVTAGTAANILAVGVTRYRSATAKRSGFFVVQRFTANLLTGHQASVGTGSTNSGLAGEPSAETAAFIGLICDSTDANWQIFSRPFASAGTKVDTGYAKTNTGALLALYMYNAPSAAGTVLYSFENEETGAVILAGTMSLTLPATTQTLLNIGMRCRNGATTTVAQINMNMMYSAARY